MPMTFGGLVRERRASAGLSLREVARSIGVSHVLLGEVERGVRSRLAETHWDKLVAAIPGLTLSELRESAAAGAAVKLRITNPTERPEVAAFTQLLARKIGSGTLSEDMARNLRRVLDEE